MTLEIFQYGTGNGHRWKKSRKDFDTTQKLSYKELLQQACSTLEDASAFANKSCKHCLSKGYITRSFPHQKEIKEICTCVQNECTKIVLGCAS